VCHNMLLQHEPATSLPSNSHPRRTSSMLLETALLPMLALILVRNLRPGGMKTGQQQEQKDPRAS